MSAIDEVRAIAAERATRHYRVEQHTFDGGQTVEVTVDDWHKFFDSSWSTDEVSAAEKALRALKGVPQP